MKSGIVLIIMLSIMTMTSVGQPATSLLATTLPPPDDSNDPGYALYKAGYDLILDEGWTEARKKFAEVIAKFPKSEYVDDAQYWSAYALMHTDSRKAIDAYRRFIEKYAQSSYYDDAVADLGQLDPSVLPTPAPDPGSVTVTVTPRTQVTPRPVAIAKAPRAGVGYAYSYNMRRLNRELRMAHGTLAGTLGPFFEKDKLDPETRLKMEALYAIGDAKEDDKSFQTLRDVALDEKQARPLREAALDALADFRKFDALPVFVDIARKDTSKEMQMAAIAYIGEHGKDKNKAVDVLVDLFNSLPAKRTEQAEMLFYSIAEVGNDKAVDFLTKVALTNENYDLRTNAVYYLGSIGGEKARTALYQILKGK